MFYTIYINSSVATRSLLYQ